MSLRHALLGLLAEESASGYDLTRRFSEGIGGFAWSARHSQIYPELIKLADEGLVEVIAEGARNRRVYGVTVAGRESLRAWLMSPPEGRGSVRNEFVLRLFLLSTLGSEDASRLLAGVIAYAEEQLEVLSGEQQAMAEAGRPAAYGPNLAAVYGTFSYRATRDWAVWAREQLGSDPAPAQAQTIAGAPLGCRP